MGVGAAGTAVVGVTEAGDGVELGLVLQRARSSARLWLLRITDGYGYPSYDYGYANYGYAYPAYAYGNAYPDYGYDYAYAAPAVGYSSGYWPHRHYAYHPRIYAHRHIYAVAHGSRYQH
jgi:hypothetical protein